MLCALRGHMDEVKSVCFSPCGEKIVGGGGDQYGKKDYSIRIWDVKTGERRGTLIRRLDAVLLELSFPKRIDRGLADSADATDLTELVDALEQLILLRESGVSAANAAGV